MRNRPELNGVAVLLGKIGQAGEQEDENGEKHQQHGEFLVASSQRVAERLKASRVTCELQYAHDA